MAGGRQENFSKAFGGIWEQLFQSPVHLDSALSKQSKNMKTLMAQIVPRILLRPSSIAEELGVGVTQGEPWTLSAANLMRWRPASIMADRMHQLLEQGGPQGVAIDEDYPPEMLKEWKREWGDVGARALVRELGREAPLSLRAYKRVEPEVVLRELRDEGAIPVKAELSPIAPRGIRLAGYARVLQTGAFERGEFEIQDEGSQLMSLFALWPELYGPMLSQEPGAVPGVLRAAPTPAADAWNVVDACAGAGGKTLALADALGNRGRIYSYDTSSKKLQALRKRSTRAGFTNIQSVAVTEGKENEVTARFRRRADAVLVDAPCSGWGVLRRNPDIKWRQDPGVLERMPIIQRRILGAYSDLVAPGGTLTFGVCTFRKAETTGVVEAFLADHPEFEAREGGYLGPGPCDGFFMQSFRRKKGS